MSSQQVWDALVVGGGPAGSATALHLARRGHAVLLMDRERFPRPKPCGECLSPGAVSELNRLGVLPRVLDLPHAVLDGWTIRAPGGSSFDGTFHPDRRGIAVHRALLDALLMEEARRAGTEVRCGVQVVAPVVEEGMVVGVRVGRGSTSEILRARLVIGADGLRSVIARRLGLVRRRPRLRKLALTAHVKMPHQAWQRGELQVLETGCIGMAAVGDDLVNVTVVVAGDEVREVAGSRERYFDAALAAHPVPRECRRVDDVLATGPFDVPIRSATANGALLVGDAAGYFDPFTGQGIYRALRGAALAAEAGHAALTTGDLSANAMRGYETARRQAFSSSRQLQRLIEVVVTRPGLMDLAARTLDRSPGLADRLVAVTGDVAPVRSLMSSRLFAGRAAA